MAGLGWKADTRPGRMSALTNTGLSEALKRPDLNVRYRPEADTQEYIDRTAQELRIFPVKAGAGRRPAPACITNSDLVGPWLTLPIRPSGVRSCLL
jgi:hypothetical protein